MILKDYHLFLVFMRSLYTFYGAIVSVNKHTPHGYTEVRQTWMMIIIIIMYTNDATPLLTVINNMRTHTNTYTLPECDTSFSISGGKGRAVEDEGGKSHSAHPKTSLSSPSVLLPHSTHYVLGDTWDMLTRICTPFHPVLKRNKGKNWKVDLRYKNELLLTCLMFINIFMVLLSILPQLKCPEQFWGGWTWIKMVHKNWKTQLVSEPSPLQFVTPLNFKLICFRPVHSLGKL